MNVGASHTHLSAPAADCTDYRDGAHPGPFMRAFRVIRAIRGCIRLCDHNYEIQYLATELAEAAFGAHRCARRNPRGVHQGICGRQEYSDRLSDTTSNSVPIP